MEVWMAWRTPVMDAARTLRPMRISSRKRSSGEDGRVCRHADGEHDARNARERKAEQAEVGKRRQDAQVQDGEDEHGARGDDAQAAVEDKPG